ncbi:MAG: tRNA (adenosine(37)-N6)-threonylcarbamoyltransferase complex ATPase subunit type 1 TsaE [Fimbriimonadaceae bacterium]|nr:tRNA (adenosine(37)-N6)-threonylcarbamoyltransferase complex ATPase subunit type 1 TsaE [Fimbriimonadaceae bacterium]
MSDSALRIEIPSEESMRAFAGEWVGRWGAGVTVLLSGELGAGKTTFVRGVLEALDYTEPVRSPTFDLIQAFETDPPVMHADLYRVESAKGIGLEDYLESHLCFVEWPDRLGSLIATTACWQVQIEFWGSGRRVTIIPPDGTSGA